MQIKNLARLAILGAVLDLAVFGVQGYQIHVLNDQQAQITLNSQKNDCWSAVLDNAIKHAKAQKQQSQAYQNALLMQARHCVKLP